MNSPAPQAALVSRLGWESWCRDRGSIHSGVSSQTQCSQAPAFYGHFHWSSRTDQWKCISKLVLDHLWAHLAPHYLFPSKVWCFAGYGHPSHREGSQQGPFWPCDLCSCSVPCKVLCSPGSWRFSLRYGSSSSKLSVFTASWPLGLSLIAGFSLLEECVHLFLSFTDWHRKDSLCPLKTVQMDTIHLTLLVSEFM